METGEGVAEGKITGSGVANGAGDIWVGRAVNARSKFKIRNTTLVGAGLALFNPAGCICGRPEQAIMLDKKTHQNGTRSLILNISNIFR
jgi:hypothetical protein